MSEFVRIYSDGLLTDGQFRGLAPEAKGTSAGQSFLTPRNSQE